jgi:DNA polymerase-1
MKLMLLDTYGLVYRAFFALPGLTTSRGVPINAAYGFTMMLAKLLADERPTHVIAAFDKGMPAERLAMYKEYKAQREAMPDDLRSQFPLVRRILATYGIPIVEMEGQEADDVIATLARQVEDAGEHTVVVTGDLDLLQLVDESTTILTTRRGITELGRYDPPAVRERFGLEPAQLPDYRGLKGDPSDNLPGIPGVGEKTATKLLQAAGSLDALVANPALAGTPKLQALIEKYGEQAQLCRTVSIVRRDLPLSLDREASRYRAPSDADLYKLYSEFEFKGLRSSKPRRNSKAATAATTRATCARSRRSHGSRSRRSARASASARRRARGSRSRSKRSRTTACERPSGKRSRRCRSSPPTTSSGSSARCASAASR